jgi:phage FluMu protein Com
MPIKFPCPHCKKGLSVKEHLAGKRAKCPACKKVLTVPAPESAPAEL